MIFTPLYVLECFRQQKPFAVEAHKDTQIDTQIDTHARTHAHTHTCIHYCSLKLLNNNKNINDINSSVKKRHFCSVQKLSLKTNLHLVILPEKSLAKLSLSKVSFFLLLLFFLFLFLRKWVLKRSLTEADFKCSNTSISKGSNRIQESKY